MFINEILEDMIFELVGGDFVLNFWSELDASKLFILLGQSLQVGLLYFILECYMRQDSPKFAFLLLEILYEL